MATFLWQDLVFGPINSRRLGSSLGINLLPVNGKVCNFNCIYCECGWNGESASHKLPAATKVMAALEEKLSSMANDGASLDSITFSGNGEPTLHPEFAAIIDSTVALRDRFFPGAVISVLSNATTLGRPGIREALMKIDNPILKIDSASDEFTRLMNNSAPGYSVRSVLDEMMKMEGKFVLQTMFLKGEVNGRKIDCASPEMSGPWVKMVLELRPREVMMYTIDRETPLKGLEKVTVDEMERVAIPLRESGLTVQIRG